MRLGFRQAIQFVISVSLALVVAGTLSACRDKGAAPVQEVAKAEVPAAVDPVPPAAVAETLPTGQLIEVFDGTTLSINGEVRSRSESPVEQGGTRKVIRIEHFFESKQQAMDEIGGQLRKQGFRVSVADGFDSARVISPNGLTGSIAVVSADGETGLKMNNAEARGVLSFFWITPAPTP